MGNVIDCYHRRGPNESRDKDSPSTKSQRPSRRTDERVEIMKTSCPQDGKLSLNADESQVDQRHEEVERKREYYYIIILPEKNRNFTSRKKRTSDHRGDGTP